MARKVLKDGRPVLFYIHPREVDPDHPEVIYVGTDLGAYVSPDGGASWEPFGAGMSVAMINDLKVFAPGRKIRAATHGNAVFERDMYDPTITGVAELASAGGFGGPTIRVHPNPVRPGSRILFSLSETTPARISLYDVTGR